jgi:hypothetical protein
MWGIALGQELTSDSLSPPPLESSDTTKSSSPEIQTISSGDSEGGRQANFYLPGGDRKIGLFYKLQKDSVFIGIPQSDGSVVKRQFHKFDFQKIVLLEDQSLIDLNLTDYDPGLDQPVQATQKIANAKAEALIKSDPAGARVYLNGKLLQGTTPLLLKNQIPGKHTIAVRRFLGGADWWGIADVEFSNDKPLTLELKLVKPRTTVRVESNPGSAEVYLDEKPSLYLSPSHLTPAAMFDVRPGKDRTLSFFKVGYYDTTLVVEEIPAYQTTRFSVELRPVSDLNLIASQKSFVAKRKKKRIGKYLLYSAILPALAGGTYYYLAQDDYTKADKNASLYNNAGVLDERTEGFRKKSNQLNDSGDLKSTTALILTGSASLLGAVGIVLRF